MWPTTSLSQKIGIQFPIIQAPMAGGITTPQLVAAVSNAGGLGSLAAGYLSPQDIRESILQVRALTSKPFAVNLFIPTTHHVTLDEIINTRDLIELISMELKTKIELVNKPYVPNFEEQMEVLVQENVPVFSFTFGMLNESWIKKFKRNHIVLMGTATTLSEAQALEKQGIDLVVAQGSEAGGHRGSFLDTNENSLIKLFDLVPQLIDKSTIPIIAAGGIMDGRGIATALKIGASGVQMGTAFLSCDESGADPNYKQAISNMQQDNTVLTRSFSGKLARGIRNKFITQMESHQDSILNYPIQNALTSTMRKKAREAGCIDFMSMWAGQFAYLSRRVNARTLMALLIEEVERALLINN
ncbi:MAG: nitronate monooxygenase [Legionellaceae bacterium]|nr:nitronate monooxygenase [Legionellaceae bacterium]